MCVFIYTAYLTLVYMAVCIMILKFFIGSFFFTRNTETTRFLL